MPTTYSPKDALDVVRKYLKDLPLSGAHEDIVLCDIVNSAIWRSYPWRWTLSSLTAHTLVDGQQDYTLLNIADFYRMVRLRVVRTDSTPDEYRELIFNEFLAPELREGGLEEIQRFCILGQNNKIRLNVAASITSPVTMELQGEYQKTPTKITSLTSTFAFPDQYFDVFVDGLTWRLMKLSGDERYKDQRLQFSAGLTEMARAEDWGDGEILTFPNEPLITPF